MSKIEEALNKARQSRNNNLSLVNGKTDSNKYGIKTLTSSNRPSELASLPKSSSREISLMEEEKILESKELSELKVIFSEMPDHKIANAYRDLRTKLIQKSQGKFLIKGKGRL